jgi:type IV pilus assembly PilN-like protein
MPAKKQISLLPDSHRSDNLTSRIVNWVTTIGRVVIIFTELFVVIAFLSRFWLDRQNSDLSEKVRQQRAILTSTAEFEKEFTSFQKRLKIIGDLNKNSNLGGALDSLLKSTPPDIYFQKLSIDPQNQQMTTTIDTRAYSSQSVISFITNLILNKDIQKVTVSSIEKAPKTSFYSLRMIINFNTDFANQNEI